MLYECLCDRRPFQGHAREVLLASTRKRSASSGKPKTLKGTLPNMQ